MSAFFQRSPTSTARRRTSPSSRRRQRGTVALTVALLLPLLVGFAAMAVDVGHVYLVRNQLQNAADAAAIAGARTLDGTLPQLALARAAAFKFATLHQANGASVDLQLNPENSATGDIVLGHWHPEAAPPWFEPIADPTSAPRSINAVKVHGTRTSATGNPVTSWLAQAVGITSTDVAATAVAVGGGPSTACCFPIAIPDCVIDSGGGAGLSCGKKLSFRSDPTDNAGLTSLQPSGGVGNSLVRQLIDDARNGICHAPLTGDNIRLQNGNDIHPLAQSINDWITANGGPITVTVPVIASGQSGGSCAVKFNQSLPVAGFARIQIVKVWPPGGPNGNTIDIVYLCDQSESAPAGGSFFGDRATQVFVTQ